MSDYQKSLPLSLFANLAESASQAVALFSKEGSSSGFKIAFCNSAFRNLFNISQLSEDEYNLLEFTQAVECNDSLDKFFASSTRKSFRTLARLKSSPYECYNLSIFPHIEFLGNYYMVIMRPEMTEEEYITPPLFKDNAGFASNAEFISNLSHDLRTPLNAILGFSDLMRNETFGPISNPKYKNYLDDIYESSQNLLSTIDDVLEFSDTGSDSRYEDDEDDSSVFGPHDEPVDIIDMVNSTYKTLKTKFADKKIPVVLSSPNQVIEMMADHQKLQHSLHCILCHILNTALDGSSLKITTSCSTDYGITIKYLVHAPKRLDKEARKLVESDKIIEGTHHFAAHTSSISLSLSLAKKHFKTHGGDIIAQKEDENMSVIVVQLPVYRLSAVDNFSSTPVSLDN